MICFTAATEAATIGTVSTGTSHSCQFWQTMLPALPLGNYQYAWNGQDVPLWVNPATGKLEGKIHQAYREVGSIPFGGSYTSVGTLKIQVDADEAGVHLKLSGLVNDVIYCAYGASQADGDGATGSGWHIRFFSLSDHVTDANSVKRFPGQGVGPGAVFILRLMDDEIPGSYSPGSVTTQPTTQPLAPATQPIISPSIVANPDGAVWTVHVPRVRLNKGEGNTTGIQLGDVSGRTLNLKMDTHWYKNSAIKPIVDSFIISLSGLGAFVHILREIKR